MKRQPASISGKEIETRAGATEADTTRCGENCQGDHSLTSLNEGWVQGGGRDSESSPSLACLCLLSARAAGAFSARQPGGLSRNVAERFARSDKPCLWAACEAAGRHDQLPSTARLSFDASAGKGFLNTSRSNGVQDAAGHVRGITIPQESPVLQVKKGPARRKSQNNCFHSGRNGVQ